MSYEKDMCERAKFRKAMFAYIDRTPMRLLEKCRILHEIEMSRNLVSCWAENYNLHQLEMVKQYGWGR